MDETSALAGAVPGEEPWAWSVSIAGAIQIFAIRYALDGPDRLPAVDQFIGSLPSPRDLRESVLFAGLVVKLRERCTAAVHAWSAERAAAHLRSHYSEPLDLALLSRLAGCSQRTLRRRFEETFGMAIRKFQAKRRVHEALRLIARGEKVCVSALATGYRTEKNLCRVVRRLAGLTPSAVRSLDAEELQALLAAILGTTGAKTSLARNPVSAARCRGEGGRDDVDSPCQP